MGTLTTAVTPVAVPRVWHIGLDCRRHGFLLALFLKQEAGCASTPAARHKDREVVVCGSTSNDLGLPGLTQSRPLMFM